MKKIRMAGLVFGVWLWGAAFVLAQGEDGLVVLILPTENRAILKHDEPTFFQPTISKRVNSGKYGFVRSTHPDEPPPYFDRFHEGIDIKPVRRDRSGNPLDPVRAAAGGRVVYVNEMARHSNYGRYLITQHQAGPYAYYLTYAHLASSRVPPGAVVQAGDALGVLGFTGAGINRERAHLHFEVGFMVNQHFAEWFEKHGKAHPGDKNEHGQYSGKNFLGLDPLPPLLASAQGNPLSIRQLFAAEEPCFRVRVPAGTGYFDWQKRFPFQTEGALSDPLPVAWEITCNRIGFPLEFKRSPERVERPALVWIKEARDLQDSFTRGLVKRQDRGGELTKEGLAWFSLLTYLPGSS